MLQYEWKVTVGRLKYLLNTAFSAVPQVPLSLRILELAVATFALLTVSWISSTTRLDLMSYLK
jgi:hypothetical protein